jgi:hypothetical protein
LRRDFLRSFQLEVQELRAETDFELTERLSECEQHDWGRFGKLRREWERQFEDPDDVYLKGRKILNLQTRVRFPVALPNPFCYLLLLLALPAALPNAEVLTYVNTAVHPRLSRGSISRGLFLLTVFSLDCFCGGRMIATLLGRASCAECASWGGGPHLVLTCARSAILG